MLIGATSGPALLAAPPLPPRASPWQPCRTGGASPPGGADGSGELSPVHTPDSEDTWKQYASSDEFGGVLSGTGSSLIVIGPALGSRGACLRGCGMEAVAWLRASEDSCSGTGSCRCFYAHGLSHSGVVSPMAEWKRVWAARRWHYGLALRFKFACQWLGGLSARFNKGISRGDQKGPSVFGGLWFGASGIGEDGGAPIRSI